MDDCLKEVFTYLCAMFYKFNKLKIIKMKKFLTVAIFAMLCVNTFAQKGDVAVGANFSYGTEIKNIGFGVKGQYNFTNALRAELSGDYFLKKDGLSMWDVNLNLHYLFPISEKLKVYPLAGVTFTNWNWKYDFSSICGDYYYYDDYYYDDYDDSDDSVSKFGANLGGGIQYNLTRNLVINAEVKYQLINSFDQLVVGVGLAYKF